MEQMLEQFFISVLNMSLTAGVAILAVFAARLFLKRAPRIFSYGLWAVVLFRLLCPVSFAAPLSLLGALQNEAGASGRMEYVPADIGYQMEPEIQLPAQSISETVDRTVNESLPQGNLAGSVNPIQIVLYLAARIWLLGIMVLLAYSAASLIRLICLPASGAYLDFCKASTASAIRLSASVKRAREQAKLSRWNPSPSPWRPNMGPLSVATLAL